MGKPLLRLSIDLETSDPLGGWIRVLPGAAQRFDGWLELVRVIDEAMASTESGSNPAAPSQDR